MLAIAIYSIPTDAKGGVTNAFRRAVKPLITPYIFATSQWQQWNMFSPDPLRRVSTYRLEGDFDNHWKEIETIKPGTYGFFRHAAHFKLFGNILDADTPSLDAAKKRMVRLLACDAHHLNTGTPVRLMQVSYVIPNPETFQSIAWWRAWKSDVQTKEVVRLICSDIPERQS